MLPGFQYLLLPVDFTNKNERALTIALEAARQNPLRVTLLHVIATLDCADEEVDEFYARLESAAKTKLQSMIERFAEAGVNADFTILFGNRAQEIVRYAHEQDIDLIVMSSHRIDPQQPAESLGTISYHVSLLCHCPVLLVK